MTETTQATHTRIAHIHTFTMFETASDQSNPGSTVNAGASKDQKERELSSQLKDAKQNKTTKQIIPFETEGMYNTHSARTYFAFYKLSTY